MLYLFPTPTNRHTNKNMHIETQQINTHINIKIHTQTKTNIDKAIEGKITSVMIDIQIYIYTCTYRCVCVFLCVWMGVGGCHKQYCYIYIPKYINIPIGKHVNTHINTLTRKHKHNQVKQICIYIHLQKYMRTNTYKHRELIHTYKGTRAYKHTKT